jgi:hypothetical protein
MRAMDHGAADAAVSKRGAKAESEGAADRASGAGARGRFGSPAGNVYPGIKMSAEDAGGRGPASGEERGRSTNSPAIVLASSVMLGLFGALFVGLTLTLASFLWGGFLGANIAYQGGPLLGAALGVGLGLLAPGAVARRRRAERLKRPRDEQPPVLLRAFAAGRTGILLSWLFGLLLVASPFALLQVGSLPPLPGFRLVITAALGLLFSLQCARVKRFWPVILIALWPAAFLYAIDARFPCWRGSNAQWCGHLCDGPPEATCGPDDFGAPEGPPSMD